MEYIVAENLAKLYGSGEAAAQALRDMSFTIDQGEFVAVMGPSGSGKSTLLSIIGALNTPTEGTYIVDGIDVYALTKDQRADFRREFLGFVFQSFHLVPYLSLMENVMLPLVTKHMSSKEKRNLAYNALDRVGLENKGHRLPGQVSGGEQERAALARAIANHPPILLADEPTGNLDASTSDEMMELLSGLVHEGTTIVMVTHSSQCAEYAQRIIRVCDGMMVGDEKSLPKTTGISNTTNHLSLDDATMRHCAVSA